MLKAAAARTTILLKKGKSKKQKHSLRTWQKQFNHNRDYEKTLIEFTLIVNPGVFEMKGIVVFDTSYGNTQKIGETLAETLKESGVDADLFDVKNLKNLSGKDYDFLILGSPTRFGTMSFTVKSFLGKVKSEQWANKPFAAFDTENPENIEKSRLENKNWSAAEKIAEKLREKKMNQLLPVLKAKVIGEKGPLVDGEIELTKNYAKQIADKLKKRP